MADTDTTTDTGTEEGYGPLLYVAIAILVIGVLFLLIGVFGSLDTGGSAAIGLLGVIGIIVGAFWLYDILDEDEEDDAEEEEEEAASAAMRAGSQRWR